RWGRGGSGRLRRCRARMIRLLAGIARPVGAAAGGEERILARLEEAAPSGERALIGARIAGQLLMVRRLCRRGRAEQQDHGQARRHEPSYVHGLSALTLSSETNGGPRYRPMQANVLLCCQ